MAKAFTKIGRQIAIAVKQGGPEPATNPKLRLALQNARGVNMPKERIENAIKRASSKDEGDFQEVTYEGYGPAGVAIVVDCATDNPTRTVANMRLYFSRGGGSLGSSGSLGFLFETKGVFRFPAHGLDLEELELQLIDYGAEEVEVDGDEVFATTAFAGFGAMQKALEERGIALASAEVQRIPTGTVDVAPESQESVTQLIDRIEEDDDVLAVYHNMEAAADE
jgi:YebC/PmpR family DNA-binding regulatory protein